MNAVCPTPGCGAVYNLTASQVGRRMSCKKCGASLIVGETALHFADPAAPTAMPVEATSAAGVEPSPRGGREASFSDFAAQWRSRLGGFADRPTWLFGAGLLLTIVYTFFPLIDQAKVSRREAAVVAVDLQETRLEQEFKKKEKLSEGDEERRKKAREQFQQTKSYLEEDVEDAVIGQRRALYWYRYGLLLGVLLLAAGALGYLHPEQPMIRRILGAAVLIALIAVLFNSIGRFGIHVGVGG